MAHHTLQSLFLARD